MYLYFKKKQYSRSLLLLFLFLIELVACPLKGQELTKKPLHEKDYDLWSTLTHRQLSENGKWVSYSISYKTGDTLFLKNTKTNKCFSFSHATMGIFAGEEHFAYLSQNQNLYVLSLKEQKKWNHQNVLRYHYSSNHQKLIFMERAAGGIQSMVITSLTGKEIKRIPNITDFLPNGCSSKILYHTLSGGILTTGIVELDKNCSISPIMSAAASAAGKFCWSSTGKSAAFLVQDSVNQHQSTTLYLYHTQSRKLLTLRDNEKILPLKKKLAFYTDMQLRISTDDNQVFFPMKLARNSSVGKEQENVQIWKTSDTILFPMRKIIGHSLKERAVLAVWNTQSRKVFQIGKDFFDFAILTKNEKYAVTSSAPPLGRRSSFYPARDYYLTNTKTGSAECFLEKLEGAALQVSVSPDGNFIAYYKDHNWWIYDIVKERHTNCTQKEKTVWDNSVIDPGNTKKSFGTAGWTAFGSLLLYDENDIWKTDPPFNKTQRISNGREKNLRYRIADAGNTLKAVPYSSASNRPVNLDRDLILSFSDLSDGSSGLALLKPDGLPAPLSDKEASAGRLFMSQSGKQILYEEQSFEIPPRLIFKDLNTGSENLIVQSNQQQKQYQWGHKKVMHYTAGGDTLTAALLFPANYDSTKKYPMITWIYEKISHQAYQYVNPSSFNNIGLNVSNLTAKGYFILLPDIRYQAGKPGLSAAQCVTAAVKKAISFAAVDSTKIGLAGHSYGGYQVNFVLTQTGIFAAAVSGSSVADPILGSLSYSDASGVIDYWRYEDQQFRFGKSFYEDQNRYFNNSPLIGAGGITTPLLSWAGMEDIVVQNIQSRLFFAALRRLKKDHIMLLYPNEGHSIHSSKNQKDLTEKVESWFGYYLKNEPVSWIN